MHFGDITAATPGGGPIYPIPFLEISEQDCTVRLWRWHGCHCKGGPFNRLLLGRGSSLRSLEFLLAFVCHVTGWYFSLFICRDHAIGRRLNSNAWQLSACVVCPLVGVDMVHSLVDLDGIGWTRHSRLCQFSMHCAGQRCTKHTLQRNLGRLIQPGRAHPFCMGTHSVQCPRVQLRRIPLYRSSLNDLNFACPPFLFKTNAQL